MLKNMMKNMQKNCRMVLKPVICLHIADVQKWNLPAEEWWMQPSSSTLGTRCAQCLSRAFEAETANDFRSLNESTMALRNVPVQGESLMARF